MKINILSAMVLVSVLGGGMGLYASTSPQTAEVSPVSQNQLETVAFSDTAEAEMLRRSYWILDSANKDYDGHRVKAMHQIKQAAKLLGLDLNAGDDRTRERQVWSDDRLRTADDLLGHVLNAADVKGQPKISKHVSDAISQINTALTIR
ncbi:MAG: hypothetical protein ACLQSR_03740 [Limisphaerales bacterium]